jgi:hypothetical protein
LVAWVWSLRPWRTVRREIPKRWMGERTFAWLGRYRRLSQEYEYWPQTSAAMMRVAMIHLMIRRLARMQCFSTRSNAYKRGSQRILAVLFGVNLRFSSWCDDDAGLGKLPRGSMPVDVHRIAMPPP